MSAHHTPSALRTPLCDLLGCDYPVVQTAMGWVAGSSLVAATTNAGGFGFLAGATIAADQIEAEILRVKKLTQDRPFGLNFHMFQPNAQQLLDFECQSRTFELQGVIHLGHLVAWELNVHHGANTLNNLALYLSHLFAPEI